MSNPSPTSESLRQLAAAHGVATCYRNERREPINVDADVVIRVLGLLDVEAGSEADRRRELAKLTEANLTGVLPPTIAVRVDGRPRPLPGAVVLEAEDGAREPAIAPHRI